MKCHNCGADIVLETIPQPRAGRPVASKGAAPARGFSGPEGHRLWLRVCRVLSEANIPRVQYAKRGGPTQSGWSAFAPSAGVVLVVWVQTREDHLRGVDISVLYRRLAGAILVGAPAGVGDPGLSIARYHGLSGMLTVRAGVSR